MELQNKLASKVALVTGASRGIGEAIAVALAQEGAEVILVARQVAELERVDDRIKAFGGKTLLVPLNLKEHALIDQMAFSLFERYGKLDILVGNAAVLGELRPIAHTLPVDWYEMMTVNLDANYHLLRCFEPLLRRSPKAYAALLTADIVETPRAYWGPYAVSKAGLEMLATIFREEVRPYGITVTLFNPGAVATRLRQQAMPGEDPTTLSTPEEAAKVFLESLLQS